MRATRPIRTKNNASTLASTGRSMKKREIMPACPEGSIRRRIGRASLPGARGLGLRRGEFPAPGIGLPAREGALNALGPPPVAWAQAGLNHSQLSIAHPRRDDLPLDN